MKQAITISHPTAADLPAMQALWRVSFPEDAEGPFVPWYFANRCRPDLAWLLKLNGEPAAMAFAPTTQMTVPGARITVPYLQGVATAPGLKNQGLCRALLKQVLAELTAAGYPFCVLKPFNAAFYQKFGFQFFAYLREYRLDFNDCFLLPPSGELRLAHYLNPADAAADCAAVYAAWQAETFCYAARSAADFRLLLADHLADRGMLALAYHAEKPLAYALYTTTPDGLFIRELAYTRAAAAEELLRLLAHDYREDTPKCLLMMPDDQRLCRILPETNAGWQVVPFAMYKPLTAAAQECYNQIRSVYFYEYF